MARKRSFTAFNLSFLDVMSCGFGAVVLVFLIIDHSIEEQTRELNIDLYSQVDLLEEEVRDGKSGLVKLRNTLSDVDFEMVEARGLATRINTEIKDFQTLLESMETEGQGDSDQLEALEDEVKGLQAKVRDLQKASLEKTGGSSSRAFLGEGNRQYLTGINLGGRNILILLDTSSSMLAKELVNIFRLRNMDDRVKRQAHKWRQAVATVGWITSQLPPGSKYQIYSFNTQAKPVLQDNDGNWLESSNRSQLDKAVAALDELVPNGGTSLHNAALATRDLSPLPDNIFLITDGLPTQGSSTPSRSKVNQQQRIKLFEQAVGLLPRSVPVNVILSPMEGDPMAGWLFWRLATASSGSFISPAQDWP